MKRSAICRLPLIPATYRTDRPAFDATIQLL
jgi:hypothetical protein